MTKGTDDKQPRKGRGARAGRNGKRPRTAGRDEPRARRLSIVKAGLPLVPEPTVPAYVDGGPQARGIPWTSQEVQRDLVRRLASLSGEWCFTFDVVQGQSREGGQNDSSAIRTGARILKALTFALATNDRAALDELGGRARAYLTRDGVRSVHVTETGAPIGLDDYDTLPFARGGDVEVERPDALRELHRAVIGWLEGGASGPATAREVARYTCLRVDCVASPLRELAREHGVDLRSVEEAAALAGEFERARRRKDAPTDLWRLAERLLVRAAIRWGMPEPEAFKLFSFQRKEGAKLDAGRPDS